MVDGFFWVEVLPLPKFQRYEVLFPVEVFVMATTSGEQPLVLLQMNDDVIADEVREKNIKVQSKMFFM